ncbi:hypothetical protein NH8B_1727 [Pseudogulbenkiania sp. NH8B]|uniref:hypothetical protein n=1 Tax=Pseudogulbenkiania sp. (strain NH8B) TaxID=748280 RepID=UPI0002279CF1|nr:hypothetical protein [Pseudogulbenkiania sp. NH8B]BAK76544.1 hypothetical protein NH8B_1727 [Pseudogulbenkiania sp. NH8B]
MNPSQNASLPAGLELPVLTDVVEEAAPPVLAEEPPFELPDFDFSGELDAMATAMPDAAAIELEIPELPLDDVLDLGPMPAGNEPVVDFSNLPSLDLDVAALDELALGDVLPELQKAAPVPPESEAAPAGDLGAGVFNFVLTPAVEKHPTTVSVEPAPLHDSAFDIPELTMEWSEPVATPDVQSENATVASVPDSVGLARPVSIPWPTEDAPEAAGAIVPTADQDQGRGPDGVSGDGQVEPDVVAAAEPVVDPFTSWAENVEVEPTPLMDVATEPVLAQQRIDIDSLPTGVLGGGVGPEPSSSWAVTYAPSGEGDELAGVPALPELDVSFVETTEVHNLPAEEPPSPSAGVAESPTEVDGNAWLEQFVNGELTELSAAANETEEVQPSVHEEVVLDLPHGIGLAEAAAGLDSVAVDLPVLEEEEPSILASELDELQPEAGGEPELGTSAMSPDRAAMLDHVVPADGDLKDGAAGVTTAEVEASFMPEANSSAAAVPSPVQLPDSEAMPDAVAPLLERPEPIVGADTVVEKSPEPSCAVVDEQALIDSLTQKILPRMKVELSLWLQDALEMQARQMLAGVMHQLKEDYEMLFNETLRESLRQAISEIGRDERDGKS